MFSGILLDAASFPPREPIALALLSPRRRRWCGYRAPGWRGSCHVLVGNPLGSRSGSNRLFFWRTLAGSVFVSVLCLFCTPPAPKVVISFSRFSDSQRIQGCEENRVTRGVTSPASRVLWLNLASAPGLLAPSGSGGHMSRGLTSQLSQPGRHAVPFTPVYSDRGGLSEA